MHGHRFNPPLKKLTDTVLRKWYFHHYEDANDMPFGDDIADPFTSPYINSINRQGKKKSLEIKEAMTVEASLKIPSACPFV